MTSHYILTLRAWRDLWVSNKDAVVKAYGERWYRLWNFFLHWSALMGAQGTGFTYQVTLHKNHGRYNRTTPTRRV
jgi:sphingolipid C9-methyltransferase